MRAKLRLLPKIGCRPQKESWIVLEVPKTFVARAAQKATNRFCQVVMINVHCEWIRLIHAADQTRAALVLVHHHSTVEPDAVRVKLTTTARVAYAVVLIAPVKWMATAGRA